MEEFIIDSIKSAILTGWIFGIGAIGLSLIYKYLNFPDFTTIGSLIVGAICCIKFGQDSIVLGLLASVISGMILGIVTAIQINKIQVPPVIAGIITFTISQTIAYKLTMDEATVFFGGNREVLDLIISSDFTWWSVIVFSAITIFICTLIALFFKTKYGALTLAMIAEDHYIKYRHHRKESTKLILLSIGNSIIGLTGGFFAIQQNSANTSNFSDFLIIAISAYALTNFFISWINKKQVRDYLKKENIPSSSYIFKVMIFFLPWLKLADEKPLKIFTSLILTVCFSIGIYSIFMTANLYLSKYQDFKHFNFAIQGILLVIILLIPIIFEKFSFDNKL